MASTEVTEKAAMYRHALDQLFICGSGPDREGTGGEAGGLRAIGGGAGVALGRRI